MENGEVKLQTKSTYLRTQGSGSYLIEEIRCDQKILNTGKNKKIYN